MQQYFSTKKENKILYLNNDDLNHIKNVMRMKENDKVIVVYKDKSYICKLNKDLLSCEIQEIFKEKEDNISFKAYIPLLNEDKMKFILMHGTELGITEFIVVSYQRCKYKLPKKDYEKKLIRWNKIVKEASEQSYRIYKPIVKGILELDKIQDGSNVKILCSLDKENVKHISEVLTTNNINDTISMSFGPEGGLTNEEEKYFETIGFIKTSLGSTILRTETVPLFIASIRKYLRKED